MKLIKVGQSIFAMVDDEDFPLLNSYSWFCENHGRTIRAYRRKRVRDASNLPKKIFMHRSILNAQRGQLVDHVDGHALNNQRENLRFCTHSQNSVNAPSRKGSKSKYLGVSWDKPNQKWRAQIQRDRKNRHIGLYESEVEAALAYNVAASFAFREFARLNVV